MLLDSVKCKVYIVCCPGNLNHLVPGSFSPVLLCLAVYFPTASLSPPDLIYSSIWFQHVRLHICLEVMAVWVGRGVDLHIWGLMGGGGMSQHEILAGLKCITI